MARTTTFRYALALRPGQETVLRRHAGARRFAYNQGLRLVKDALDARKRDPSVPVPWSRFSLINAFNTWKTSAAAGRTFAVGADGTAEVVAEGLWWRGEVLAAVFEEATVDLAGGLKAYADSEAGRRPGPKVSFPTFKRKGRCRDSFRVRAAKSPVRIGTDGHPRSVRLGSIGTFAVHDDTRPLRRLLAKGRGRILSATVSRSGDRWYVSLAVEAEDLHPAQRHPRRAGDDFGGWVGLDRGLSAFVVGATADGVEVARVAAPAPLARHLGHLRRLQRQASRKAPCSRNMAKSNQRVARLHARIADLRRTTCHQVTARLVKTHDRLVLEDLAVRNLAQNTHLSRAIHDAAWAEFARQVRYKAAWHGGEVAVAPRFYPSTKRCSTCGAVKAVMGLDQRTYRCDGCGLVLDRAANLAAWARASYEANHQVPDRGERGRVTKARGGEGAGRRRSGGGTGPGEARTP